MVVKKGGDSVDEFRFTKGPIYIGRQSNSQVYLPDAAVSRQHAVLYSTQDGKWTVEDLDSANKTYLNEEAIHKVEIKNGDRLRIVDYTIEVELEEAPKEEKEKPIELEDTLTAAARGPQMIERQLTTPDAPPIRLPAKRAAEFLEATEAIGKAGNLDELLLALLDITSKQLGTYHAWCALRNQATGPMTCHAGRNRDGKAMEISDIKFNEKITASVEKDQYLLYIFSRDMSVDKKTQVRSIVIAPIVSSGGCFGVLYANNTFRDDHYSLSDLDYLMLLGIHTAAAI
ncbi:MAG: FHA domain-containing protein, partial [Planctomycetota bacterium]